MKKKLSLMIVSLASVSLLAACGILPARPNSQGTKVGKTIKIGLNLAESGSVASYGSAAQKGAKLAVKEINAKGGVDGKKIELIDKDNKSDNSEAVTLTSSLVARSEINAMVGPMVSSAVAAATLNATKNSIPLVTPAGTQDNLTYANGKVKKFVYRATFQDSYQGDVLAKFAYNNLKAKQVVLLYDNSSDYGKGIAKEFKKVYKGSVLSTQTYSAGDTDFHAALTKIKNLDYDAIVMPGYYSETGLITKQARNMGIDKPILGPDGFSDPTFISLATKAATNNVYYVAGYSTKVNLSSKATSFVKNFKKTYKTEPSMFNALGYDSIYMIAAASKGAKTSTDIADNLAKIKDFEGVTGEMTMDSHHNPQKPVIMVGLKNGKEASDTIVK